MVYELYIKDLKRNADELETTAIERQYSRSYFTDLVEDEASAHYYRMCAILKKRGIPESNVLVRSAEKIYAEAIKLNKSPKDYSSEGYKASRILKAISKLEKILLR